MSETLNGNLSERVVVDSQALEWTASPSGTVWRKRLHRVGAPESGQVTSVVRYEPGASFPAHDHPDGEEILVLDGVFSDEHGDWPRGTYLLNPEGFRHAPFSKEGCQLFVKLRQFAGLERRHVALQTLEVEWAATAIPGVESKPLYRQPGFADSSELQRWSADTSSPPTHFADGAEIFLLSGDLSDSTASWRAGHWIRLPAGATFEARSASGCELYLKVAGVSGLRPG